jgi:hypothetical protein
MTDGRTPEALAVREYIFDDYRIDVAAYQLWRGDHLITLTPKVFGTLAVLIQHRDRAITGAAISEDLTAARRCRTRSSATKYETFVDATRDLEGDTAPCEERYEAGSAIDERTTRHQGHAVSQRKRNRLKKSSDGSRPCRQSSITGFRSN